MKLKLITTALFVAVYATTMSSGCYKPDEQTFVCPSDYIGGPSEVQNCPCAVDFTGIAKTLSEINAPTNQFVLDAWNNADVNGYYGYTDIILSDNASRVEFDKTNGGVVIDNLKNEIKINDAGLYRLSGTLTDGRVVSTQKGDVKIILDGANISCSTSAPLVFLKSGTKVLTVAGGSRNSLSDASEYTEFYDNDGDRVDKADNKINGAIYSKNELYINGNGELNVIGNYGNGISVKDDLRIMSGNITVKGLNNAIKGKNVLIEGGKINATSTGGDGIKAETDDDKKTDSGKLYITGGTITVTSAYDGIQGDALAAIGGENTKITICSGNGSDSMRYDNIFSRKGLKSDNVVVVCGGTISVDSLDDSVYSGQKLFMNGGSLYLKSANSAISANAVQVCGGRIEVEKAYSGVTSPYFCISSGTMNVYAETYGAYCHSSGLKDCGAFFVTGSGSVAFSARTGVSTGGPVGIYGGSFVCDGLSGEGDAPIRADGGFLIRGGRTLIFGALGMVQIPVEACSQISVMYDVRDKVSALSTVALDMEGVTLFSRETAYEYGSMLFSAPEMDRGAKCRFKVNGKTLSEFPLIMPLTRGGVTTALK